MIRNNMLHYTCKWEILLISIAGATEFAGSVPSLIRN